MASGLVCRANRPKHVATPTIAANMQKVPANSERPHMAQSGLFNRACVCPLLDYQRMLVGPGADWLGRTKTQKSSAFTSCHTIDADE